MATINTSNLTVGGAEIYWGIAAAKDPLAVGGTAMGTATLHKIGNITTGEITPNNTYVEHFISVKGARKKDKEVAVTKSIGVSFTFDEITATNLSRFVLGSDVGTNAIVLTQTTLEGRAIIDFNTDVGQKFRFIVPKANLRPDGGLPLNSEDWMKGNFTVEVLYHDTYRVDASLTANLAPYGYLDMNPTFTIADNAIASYF